MDDGAIGFMHMFDMRMDSGWILVGLWDLGIGRTYPGITRPSPRVLRPTITKSKSKPSSGDRTRSPEGLRV